MGSGLSWRGTPSSLSTTILPQAAITAMAHRGFSGPEGHLHENSMKAFDAAVELGYTWVETDVHATRDGVLLAFHDSTLDRVTDQQGVIADFTWAEVSTARIAGTERVPRFDELLTRHPRLHINIDIKSPGAIGPLVACVEAHGAHDRVRITSFSERRRHRALCSLSRRVRSSPGQERMAALWLAAHIPLVGGVVFGRLSRDIDAMQIPERFGALRVLDAPLLAAAHRAGIAVHVWTVNDAADMHRLLEMGVDGLITDRADLLKNVLVQRGAWTSTEAGEPPIPTAGTQTPLQD